MLRAGRCDRPGAQVLARALLRDAAGGVELGEAWNGAEAVRRVREGGAYDLILTDRQMPVMDGHEVPRRCGCERRYTTNSPGFNCSDVDELTPTGVCVQATRQIRALGVTTPIVGLSSDSLAADADAFIKAGADDFTPKVSHQLTACSVMHRLLSCTRDRWAEQQ